MMAASLEESIKQLNIHLKPEQELALKSLLVKKDVLAILPTGFGKSRIYEAFAAVKDAQIVLVVAPLTSIIKDQIAHLNRSGIPSADLSGLQHEDLKTCKFKILFSSAEEALTNEFTSLLKDNKSEIHKRLSCIVVDETHTVETWSGKRARMTKKKKKAKQNEAFRSAYGKLSTLRSLCKEGVPVLALTATADQETQKVNCRELVMKDPVNIFVSPHRENIRFSVHKCIKEKMHEKLDWLVEMIKENGANVPKTIIFCNTIKEVSVVINYLIEKLGKHAYFPSTSSSKEHFILGVYHSMTWPANKEAILNSMSQNGVKRVIVATTALSMGVNFQDVRYIINWGPARTLLDQLQEAGRAGRDGKKAHVIILYHGQQLAHCEEDVKEFVKTTACYRVSAYKPFDGEIKPLEVLHDCCANCATICNCGNCTSLSFEKPQPEQQTRSSFTRPVTADDEECIRDALKEIRETMPRSCSVFGHSASHGFSEELIDSIVENSHQLFTLNDINSHLPVFSLTHSLKILELMDEIFSDILHLENTARILNEEFGNFNHALGILEFPEEIDTDIYDTEYQDSYISEKQLHSLTDYLESESEGSDVSDNDFHD